MLLTCDRDYLDEQRFPLIHCPAIVVFDFGSGSLLEVRQAFKCLRSMYSAPQFFDKWVNMIAGVGAGPKSPADGPWSNSMGHRDREADSQIVVDHGLDLWWEWLLSRGIRNRF